MSTQTIGTTDATETRTGGETDSEGRERGLLSTVRRGAGNGTPAALAGGGLLVAAARTAARHRRRAGAFAVAGVALLGAGIRRRSATETSRPGGRIDGHSAEAAAHRSASDLVDRSETNPRGVSDESAVGSADGDGAIRFSAEGDETGEPRPHLDGSDPADPRYADREDPLPDDHVEVSLSKTKTTDELGKAVAPDEEQAYPASEGTDPEPMAEEAPPRYGEGAGANEDAGSEEREQADDGPSSGDDPSGEETG